MRKLGVLLAIGALALAQAAGTRVTLYPRFAELAEPVRIEHGVFVWQPGERVAAALVQDLVWMTGTKVLRRVWRNGNLWIFAEGERGVLHHLTRGLSGSVRYALDVDAGRLLAWLRAQNELDAPLEVEELRFVSGSVPLVGGVRAVEGRMEALAAPVAKSAEAPVFAGSTGGVFRYRLAGPLVLEPEVTELPLFELAVKPAFYWRYAGPFQKGRRLPFRRGYRFLAPKPLAAGTFDLFAGGDFLGRLGAPDTYAGERVELELGPAPRARSERRIEVLAERRDLRRYRVETRVKNPGDEPVHVEVEEFFQADEVELVLSEGERRPRGYRVAFELPPGGEHRYRYEVTLRYKRRE